MRKASLAIVALVCCVLAGLAGGATQNKAPAKKPAATAAAKSSKPAKKPAKSAKSRSRKPSTQQTPDPARVREIQEALATHGYNVEVSGKWGPQSVEALKKFQEDKNINNLTGRGKLDSLTLIALGLGPPRSPAAVGNPAVGNPADPKLP